MSSRPATEGGSLFVLASGYPAQLNYSLDIGGAPDVAQGALTTDGRYSTQTLKVNLAELTVHLLSGQSSPCDP